ncbi:MAG: carbohydrate-binding family 9-like protein [Bacteroidota bacterium]
MKRNLMFKLFLLCLILAGKNVNNVILAVSPDPGSITVKKCQDFIITGDGSSDNWKSTGWVNVVPQGSYPSVYQTKVKVLYSGKGIYFLFDCEDKKLTSTMKADYLNLFTEDVVEVFLWTDENFPVYFEYELSPLNYELPIIIPNYKGTAFGWLPWHYEGDRKTQHATSAVGGKKKSGGAVSGWIAEFFIPYKLLAPLNQVPPASGTKWRANMYRIDYDNGTALYAWQKISKSFHEYNNFGVFIFE